MKKIFGLLLVFLVSTVVHAADWFPVATMTDGRKANYLPITKVSNSWRICVLIPNGVDKFWWGVGWALNEDAKRFNLKLGIYNAGGYDQLEQQRAQFNHCRSRNADAIVLAAIQPNGLNREITAAMASGVVVVDMINRVEGVTTTARSASDAKLLGKLASSYLIEDAAGQPVTVAWFPGPEGADWVIAAERGALPVLSRPTVKLIRGGNALPDVAHQMTLVRSMTTQKSPADYMLANAPAAEAAARLFSSQEATAIRPKIVSYYASEPVFQFIKDRQILAAASNSPVLQAHIALDLALRSLEGTAFPKDVQVIPEMIDSKNVDRYDTSKLFAPANTWIGLRDMPD